MNKTTDHVVWAFLKTAWTFPLLALVACSSTGTSTNASRFLSNAISAYNTSLDAANQVAQGWNAVTSGQPINIPSVETQPVAAENQIDQRAMTGSTVVRSDSSVDDGNVIDTATRGAQNSQGDDVIVIPLQPLIY